ncbi:MAG: hypothetical protein AAF436_01305 [Myxococcota bacterium]
MRFFAYVLLAAAAVVGCGDAAPPAMNDGGPDAGPQPDGGSPDGGPDGGVPDGGPDGGPPEPACGTTALCPACPDPDDLCEDDDGCAIGEVCLATGCDDLKRCFTSPGGRCVDGDCGDPLYACDPEADRCLRIEPGCLSSSDCVVGFACEDGACVDRRVPCTTASDCPHGYACRAPTPDQRFCRRVTQPCTANIDCQELGVLCGDPDGDGQMECMAPSDPGQPGQGSCDNSQCTSTDFPVCELTEQGTGAPCGRFGLCASEQDCADGFACADLWGDGRSECVLPDGSCADSRDCSVQQVCASSRSGDPPACIAGAEM